VADERIARHVAPRPAARRWRVGGIEQVKQAVRDNARNILEICWQDVASALRQMRASRVHADRMITLGLELSHSVHLLCL